MSYALRFINFTGYTGQIYFSDEELIRAVKSFYIFNAYNNTVDATLVGYANESGTEIYNDLIKFNGGKIPISSIKQDFFVCVYPLLLLF